MAMLTCGLRQLQVLAAGTPNKVNVNTAPQVKQPWAQSDLQSLPNRKQPVAFSLSCRRAPQASIGLTGGPQLPALDQTATSPPL